MNDIAKVIIIGSGPAGYTAGLYAARATLSPILFKGSAPNLPGGQLMLTSDVENYPGFPKSIQGPELMESFLSQAKRFGCIMIDENIVEVDFKKRPFKIISESKKEYLAEAVIIATGANAQLLGLPKEKELMASGAGVSACATCDGAFYKNAEVFVIGGGDTAMEEALFLTKFAKGVTVIHRSENFKASRIMLERARRNQKISWMLNQEVKEILTAKSESQNREYLSGLLLSNTASGQKSEVIGEGMFVAIGHKPNTELFAQFLKLDERGYIKTLGQSSKTEIPGVFAAGDVQDSVYRQAVTAAGSGCMAAIDAERFLEAYPGKE